VKTAVYVLSGLLLLLQYPLWFSTGGVASLLVLQRQIVAQKAENARLEERNQALEAEVLDLEQGLAAVEDRARSELGMVKKGETFYQIIEQPDNKRQAAP